MPPPHVVLRQPLGIRKIGTHAGPLLFIRHLPFVLSFSMLQGTLRILWLASICQTFMYLFKKNGHVKHNHFHALEQSGVWMVTVISWWTLDGYCYFLVDSGWLLLIPGGLWMVTVDSWWTLDGYCHFLVDSGWLLLDYVPLSLTLLDSLVLGVLSAPPYPAKNPLHPTQAPALHTVSFNRLKKNATRKLAGANFRKMCSGRRDTAAGPRVIEKQRGRAESKERGGRQLTVDSRQTGSPTLKGGGDLMMHLHTQGKANRQKRHNKKALLPDGTRKSSRNQESEQSGDCPTAQCGSGHDM